LKNAKKMTFHNISDRSDGPDETYFRTMATARMNFYQPKRPSSLGATPLSDGSWRFVVWAPHHKRVELHLQPHSFAVLEYADPALEA
jgi:1,4-alpha-glucan branching enzyme